MLMRTLFAFPFWVSIFIFLSGCTSSQIVKQRSFIEPAVLAETVDVSKLDKSNSEQRIERMLVHERFVMGVTPQLKTHLAQASLDESYKKGLPKAEADRVAKALTDALPVAKNCFLINVISSRNEEDAKLEYFGFHLEADGKLFPLKSSLPLAAPKSQMVISATASAGKTAEASVDSSYRYTNESLFCTQSPVNSSQGYMVYVTPRQKRDDQSYDLVWSTNPVDRQTFAYGRGLPNQYSKQWENDRIAAYTQFFHKLAE